MYSLVKCVSVPHTPIAASPHTWTLETLAAFFAAHLTALEERLVERAEAHAHMHVALETRLTEAQSAHISAHLASHVAMEDKIARAFEAHRNDHELLKEARDAKDMSTREATDIAAKQAELWRANANEWRGAMDDRERLLMPRHLAEQQFTNVNERMAELLPRMESRMEPLRKDVELLKLAESRGIGARAMAISIASGVLAVLSLAVVVVSMFRH